MPMFDRGMLSFLPGVKAQTRPETDRQGYATDPNSLKLLDQQMQPSPRGRKPALAPLPKKAAATACVGRLSTPRRLPTGGKLPPAETVKLKPIHPEHDDCLRLPKGLDRLWLLLPAEKRPLLQELCSQETARDIDKTTLIENIAKAFFGSDGALLLESFVNTAEARAPWAPSRLTHDRNLPLISTWKCVPFKKPLSATWAAPVTGETWFSKASISKNSSLAALAMSRQGFLPERSQDSYARPFNTSWAEVFADQLDFEREEAQMRQTQELEECGSSFTGGILDLRWWSQHPSKVRGAVDERAFALAALASETRPAHMVILASPVILKHCKIFSLWSRLQQIWFEDGDIASVEGIEGCRILQKVHFKNCRKLCDITPLGRCQELSYINLNGCIDLVILGDAKAAQGGAVQPCGLFGLSNLQYANLAKCNGLSVEQLTCLYKVVQPIIFPNSKLAMQCAMKIATSQHTQFISNVKGLAQEWLEETIERLVPPITCSWAKYKEFEAERAYTTQYAKAVGVSETTLWASELMKRRAKLLLHLGQVLSGAENAELLQKNGHHWRPRIQRCFVLIRWLRIRRVDGVTRKEFCSVLGKALDQPKYLLSRVYNFIDVERQGVLTEEDFGRLSTGYHGPAKKETIAKFREWAFDNFGSLEGLFSAITQLNKPSLNSATTDVLAGILADQIDYWAFEKILKKLGWKGQANELFALLNDHKPKNPYITVDEFLLFDWLGILDSIDKFKVWMVNKHGSTEAAFKAIDLNRSKAIHSTELRKYIKDNNVMPGIGAQDIEHAFHLIDFNDSASITHKEFEVLSMMDTTSFLGDLTRLSELLLIKWGSFHKAFSAMSSIEVSNKKAKLGKKARTTKAAGIRFVHLEQFRLAAEQLAYEPTHDLQLIFRYLDFNMEGTIVLEDFMVLPVATSGDVRECFSKVRDYLERTWGSFQESYTGLSRAAQLQANEEKSLGGHNPDEGVKKK